MLIKRLSILLVAAAASGTTFAAETPSGLQIRTTRPDARVTFERSLADGKALVSVANAKQEPVLGLTVGDFAVARPDAAAKVIAVEPITQSIEVPRHVVLVLDNSYSMVERRAITTMLAEVGEVLKAIRPIDDVHMVVFRGSPTMNMGGRDLHVETFQSNKPSELEAFAANACKPNRITATTRLYEGMLAGLELVRGTPVNDPRFLMVFSDGEEMNSAFKGEVVSQSAKEVPNLHVFAIDCMRRPGVDPFLASFASQNGGQAWKAGTGADLPALFQQSGSKLEHHYAVSYEFAPPAPPPPPPPPPPPSPRHMVFQQASLFDFNASVLKPEGMEQIKAYREQVRAELSSARAVKITGHTDNVGAADYNMKLSLRRAEAVRDYLVKLGVDPSLLEISGEGMTKPVADNSTAEGRAKNRRVEVEVTGLGK